MIERLSPTALGRDFRWLWASSVVTNIGDGVLLAAGPLLFTTVTREPLAVALAVFLQQLPWVVLGVPAGARRGPGCCSRRSRTSSWRRRPRRSSRPGS